MPFVVQIIFVYGCTIVCLTLRSCSKGAGYAQYLITKTYFILFFLVNRPFFFKKQNPLYIDTLDLPGLKAEDLEDVIKQAATLNVARQLNKYEVRVLLYVQEVVTQPKILNRTILYNLVHVT